MWSEKKKSPGSCFHSTSEKETLKKKKKNQLPLILVCVATQPVYIVINICPWAKWSSCISVAVSLKGL